MEIYLVCREENDFPVSSNVLTASDTESALKAARSLPQFGEGQYSLWVQVESWAVVEPEPEPTEAESPIPEVIHSADWLSRLMGRSGSGNKAE